MKNNKPYKYNAKDRLQKSPPKKKKTSAKKNVTENTIKIDDTRLNDSNSLDTSFLEGRVGKKVTKDNKAKEKILTDRSKTIARIRFFRNLFLSLSGICVIILIILYSVDYFKGHFVRVKQERVQTDHVESPKSSLIDSNYLFVGDFYTQEFSFDDFNLDYRYVKTGKDNFKTTDLLDDMKGYIYQYNPSIVFIQLGFEDIQSDLTLDDTVNNLKKIIQLIQENRPYTEIYVESIYPIDSTNDKYPDDILITNEKIKEYNNAIESMIKENEKAHFIDIYSFLVNGDLLEDSYTEDGISLNKDGYQQVYKIIQKIVG